MRLAPSKIREFGAAADPPRAQCQRRAPLSLRSGSGGFETLPVHLDLALVPGALPSGSTIASGLMIQPSHSGPNTRRFLCSLNSFTADFPGFRRPDFVSVCGRQCDVAPGMGLQRAKSHRPFSGRSVQLADATDHSRVPARPIPSSKGVGHRRLTRHQLSVRRLCDAPLRGLHRSANFLMFRRVPVNAPAHGRSARGLDGIARQPTGPRAKSPRPLC
jgi:hypothetical protein